MFCRVWLIYLERTWQKLVTKRRLAKKRSICNWETTIFYGLSHTDGENLGKKSWHISCKGESLELWETRLKRFQVSQDFLKKRHPHLQLGVGNSNVFYAHPYLWKWSPIWRLRIFFKWVGEKPPTSQSSFPFLLDLWRLKQTLSGKPMSVRDISGNSSGLGKGSDEIAIDLKRWTLDFPPNVKGSFGKWQD